MQCPNHKKRLQVIIEPILQFCEICGRAATLKCQSCVFRQCSECRICPKRHNMLKIIELNTVNTEYHKNDYMCDSCSKASKVDDDGIWHCNQCNYGLCPDCAD